jgi:hypothetical protein
LGGESGKGWEQLDEVVAKEPVLEKDAKMLAVPLLASVDTERL